MPVPSDFRLYHGNDLELLAGVLAAELARPGPETGGDALPAPDTILVPQPALKRWLQKGLAEAHGIAANLVFLAPGEFVRRALDANVPGAGDAAVGDAATLRWRLWSLLADADAMAAPVFAPLQPALAGSDPASAAWALAGELAQVFEKYQAWRRDWLRGWDRHADRDDWQAELWRRATRGRTHRGRRLDAYLARFAGAGHDVPQGLPARTFAFACQNVSPDALRVIASAARAGPLHFFVASPVRGWWGDLRTGREPAPADALAGENPLLRANGAAGRDFLRTLFDDDVVQPAHEFAFYRAPASLAEGIDAAPADAGRGGDPGPDPGQDLFAAPAASATANADAPLLHRLQRDLLERAPPPRAAAALPVFADTGRADASLQVHNCHTRLREVQVLQAQLRALLEADPALEPREIAVLAPDIDAYAPFVAAVFGGSDAGNAIPYALGDAGVLARQPVVAAFAQLLALPDAKLAANEVLDLFAVPAIGERHELGPADLATLGAWLAAAGARWGLDGAHRERLGAPREDAYTWAFALDRLLLGHASGSDADPGSGPGQVLVNVAPLPGLDGGTLALLDRLVQGLRRLAQWQRALAAPRTPDGWGQALAQLIDDFFPERARDPADRVAVDDLRALAARFAAQAATAEVDEAVPPAVVRAWFAAEFAATDARAPLLTGGVTFGRMVPLRLVPFKVICLLGLDDGAFPRRDPPGSLNRLAAALDTPQRRVGDRSVRDDDRGLFLQLFAAAGQCFYCSFLGQDPRSGEAGPPSVVVSELLDVAARYYADADVARRDFVVRHPLQPFSPATLGADAGDGSDARRFAFAGGWATAAAQADAPRAAPAPFATPLPLALPLDAPATWTMAQLCRALGHPPRAFLCERLGLRVPEADDRLDDEEPFDAGDGLLRFGLAERTFALCQAPARPARAALAHRLLAEGRLAPGAAGVAALDAVLAQLAPALAAWTDAADNPARTLAYDLDLGDGTRITGTLAGVHRDGLRQFSASRAHGKTLLTLGLDALAWAALGQPQPVARCVRDAPVRTIALPTPAQARAALRVLAGLAARAQREALPFMPKAAWCFAGDADPESGWRKAAAAWRGEPGGEGSDAWVRVALRGAAPFAGDDAVDEHFYELARTVFALLPGAAFVPGADPAAGPGHD